MFNNRQPPEQQQQQKQTPPRQPPSFGPRRGMTPRMLELSRRLSDIEFQEYIPTPPPVVSPSAFSRQGGRKRGSIAEVLSAHTQQQQQHPQTAPHMGLSRAAPLGRAQSPHMGLACMAPPERVQSPLRVRPPQRAQSPPRALAQSPPRALAQSPPRALAQSPPPALAQSPPRALAQLPRLAASPRALIATVIPEDDSNDAAAAAQLRERLRVPTSEPSRLGGLELVEPAKVDTQYAEDRETSEYRQRRRARESIGTAGAAGDERRSEGRRRLVALTRRIHEDWDEVSTSLRELRALVAGGGGLPVGTGSQMRATLWLAMLEVRTVAVQGYVSALEQCPSTSAAKIDNDAFRTLAGDVEFRRAVPTEAVVRVLNAVLSAPDRLASDPPRYVQGMNTLLAPFLWVMGESAAFHAFRQFLRNECPLYARPSLPGVHACVQLVDECLAAVDPRLFSHLKRHGAVAKIYAFPAAMTLSASVGPLRQVVRLWDFLLAFGVHMNVVCIVAQLVAMRELLLTTRSPMALLRAWPPLRADAVIRRTREIYDVLPERLRRYIKHHAHDPHLAERLASAPQVADPLSEPAVCTLPSSPRSPFSPFSPRSPAPAALPPPLQQPSLKRDLPLSPDAGAAASACSSSPASRSSSAASRPRARTFSGMVKRPRTDGRSRTDVQPVGLPVSTLARSPPPYGSIGLGILAPSARADTAPHQQRASSSSGVTRKPRMVRITAAAASPDTRWLPDRKLSADHRDAHH